MAQQSLVNSVRKYLISHHMYAVDEWLSGFVEYLIENNDRDCKENEVQTLAKEQWLLNDLKDICPGCLPPNLRNQKSTTLNGRFVLQINAAVDIGTPAYQQYLKLQKVNTENVEATINNEDKVSSHRMIKLYLTDGVQEVSAIEYRPMRNLSCDITPGCKLLLKGPVECRRGLILLTEGNVELLGGEVQELADANSLACLLSSKLGLPATVAQENPSSIHRPNNVSHQTAVDIIPALVPTNEQTPRDATSMQTETFADDDLDMEQLAAIEAQFVEHPAKRPLYDSNSRPEKKIKVNTEDNSADDYPADDDLMFEDEDYLREMEAQFDAQDHELNERDNRAPVQVSKEPFVYIKQIKELSDTQLSGKVFKVKAQIMKLLSKLSVGRDGWSLKCEIVDGTGTLNVDFTSDVLSELVGLTPIEVNRIKKHMATKPEMKEKAVMALQKAKEHLQVLYCIIELTMLDGPKITRLIPFNTTHVDLLKKREVKEL
ncbi:recQ-mediated genome instability protein 1-like [Battus philenor]|uniref:recQ-mediated genome instability protein 1-like n=1 Tax=Battus philenor TaxID=42288 RepID=UPI0035CF3FEB